MCPREKPTSQDNRLATWSRCKYHHHIPQKPLLRRPSNGNSILTIQNQIKSKYQFLSDSMSLELQKVWKFKNTHIGTPPPTQVCSSSHQVKSPVSGWSPCLLCSLCGKPQGAIMQREQAAGKSSCILARQESRRNLFYSILKEVEEGMLIGQRIILSPEINFVQIYRVCASPHPCLL